jgi:hypothetical protein
MSVQDDVGFVKLVSRFIGTPIDIYRNGVFLMGTLKPAPSTVSTGATVMCRREHLPGERDARRGLPQRLAPDRPVREGPGHHQRQAAPRCAAPPGEASQPTSRPASNPLPPHYRDLVGVVRATTNGVAFVRAGSKQLAGGPGPARLPSQRHRHLPRPDAGRCSPSSPYSPRPDLRAHAEGMSAPSLTRPAARRRTPGSRRERR